MPTSLEQLDLLLLTVASPRIVHPDGIHYQTLRYLDPVLAEIRVFNRDRFLCRAICGELAGRTVGINDITAARTPTGHSRSCRSDAGELRGRRLSSPVR